MSVDLLVFGPHPDDIEIGAGGLVARHVALGLSVGLCDLTAGEMGSNGTVEERLHEAERAREVLGAAWRENLRLPDRRIGGEPADVDAVITIIRRHRPRVIVAPYWVDRHPDHGAASALVDEAVFNAGLRRYRADGEPWKPEWVCYYFINDGATPSFVVDVTEHYETKRRALDCYTSQFLVGPNTVGTRLNTPVFRQLVESRDAQFGALVRVPWAEGVVVREPVVRQTVLRT
jgi:bacillithiol biosynthesis deacetylase BshB1